MSRRIEIVDVGPRDGLQNEAVALSVAERLEFISRLEAAGVSRLEAVSFVNPARVPQMAGAEEIMAALPHTPGRSRIGLVLNLRGWERLKATSCDEANVVVCATDSFGLRNQGAGHLRHALGIDERHRLDPPRAGGFEHADELQPLVDRQHDGLVLQPVPGPDFDDLDAAAHRDDPSASSERYRTRSTGLPLE